MYVAYFYVNKSHIKSIDLLLQYNVKRLYTSYLNMVCMYHATCRLFKNKYCLKNCVYICQ